MAEAPAGGAGGAAGAKQDPQALIAKHAAVTQAGAQGDAAIVSRVENAIKNSPMGWLQGVLGETGSRASSEQSQVSGKLAEHKDLVANQKDVPKDAGPPPAPGPAAHPAVPHPAAPAHAAVAAPAPAAGGAAEHHAPIAGASVPKSAPAAAPAAAPAPTVASAVAGAGDSQIDGILNGYTPKGAQSTQTVGRIKSMGDIAQGFNGQLDTYIAQGGAVEHGIASTANFLGVGKDVSAVWANNPYRKVHGILGGIMTGMSAVKNVCGVVGSICGKLGMVLTVIGLLGMIFPPIGAAVSGIARILNVVGLICDSISFVLSGILTGLNGVVLAQQIAAGASAEEKAATADLMMSEANEAASGFVNLAMVFGPKFMKGLLGNSKGIVASLIKRAKATIGRISLKLSANVSHFANKIVRKLGFGGSSFERVGGAWKDTGFLARTKETWAGSKVGKAFSGAPQHLQAVQDKLMAKYGNTAWAKGMDRVGAWGGSVAHKMERFDLGEQAGRLGEKSGSAIGGAFADTKVGKSMAAAAERSELQTRELTMKMEARDAAHLEESRWKNQLDRRQTANPDHVREPGAEQKFVAGQGQKVRDEKMADFQSQERQREAKDRLEALRTERFERRNDEFYENKTNGITGVGKRDEMMAGVHNTRERRYELEAQFKPQETERKELLAKATKSASEQERLTALNGELRQLDEARRVNKMYETDLSGLASGAERVRAPEYNNWKDVGSNAWEATAPALEMVHLKDQDSAWAMAEKADLKKQTKYNKGTAQANAAGRGGHGTFADIEADARHRELDEMTEFVRAAPQTRSVTNSVKGMLSPIINRGAPAAAAPTAVAPTQAPAPVGPGPAHAPGGVSVAPTEHKEGDPVGDSVQVAAQVHEPPVTAAAPAHEEKKEAPDEAGGEALPYWPALIPEFDKATHDFGWMRKVAVEFKKAQIDGKQKAVDTLAVYGRYKEYAAARAAAAQKNSASAAQTGQATQQNVAHANQTEGQAGQGEQKQGEAKGAANDKAATELPEPESRGFWGRILGAVKRWAKNKAAQVFGWIQEKIASVILKGLCGVSMGDMREYAGALRRQQQAAHGVADGAGKTSGQAQQNSIKLSADATKEAQGAADAIGECDKNIVDADQFMADIGSFEQQLAEEKAHAQMFIASVHSAAEAERTKQQMEAAQHAAEEKKEQERAAQLGGGSGAPAATPTPAATPVAADPAAAAATTPAAGEPASEDNAQDVSQIHAASQYVATESEAMTSKLDARADDYTNQLALALTNRTGKGADGVDLKGPAKKESKHIVEEFKAAAQHTKIDMEAFHNMSIDPSQAKRIAEQIITSAQHLEETYNHSENALDELFARTYNGIKDGRRTLKSRALDGDNAAGAVNHAGDAVDNKTIDTALPKMNTAWDTVAKPIQTPAPAPAPVLMASNDAAPVQRKATGEAAGGDPNAIATAGVQSANERIPHHDQIQASFGRHDVSGIRAQTGGGAAEASRGLGASAYAVGNRVGFAQSPDLHTAAHEAAHVVQQQAGVQLKGGIDGGKDDPHEQHADAVADKVVRGESAEGLLDMMGPTKSGASASSPVQRKGVPNLHGMVDAVGYLQQNSRNAGPIIRAHLIDVKMPNPAPRLAWAHEAGFYEAFLKRFELFFGDFEEPGRIARVLSPEDPFAVIDSMRAVTKGAKGEGSVIGSWEWIPAIGHALAQLFEQSMIRSLYRLGPRYIDAAEAGGSAKGEVSVDPDQVPRSHPMDQLVLPAMCRAGVLTLHEDPTGKRKGPAKQKPGLRDVQVDWVGTKELWNWVRARPADATAEEVAAKLLAYKAEADHEKHADYYAAFLTGAPPLFCIPPQWAANFSANQAFRPTEVKDLATNADHQIVVLGGSAESDNQALLEAGVAPKEAKPAASAKGKPVESAADMIGDIRKQLNFLKPTLAKWRFGDDADKALAFLTRRDHDGGGEWKQVLMAQRDGLALIATGMLQMEAAVAQMGVAPMSREAQPLREIMHFYGDAVATSHLKETSKRMLARANNAQAALTLQGLRGTIRDMDSAADMMRSGVNSTDWDRNKESNNVSGIDDEAVRLQTRLMRGSKVDASEVEDVQVRAEEAALNSRMIAIDSSLAELEHSADEAGQGLSGWIASLPSSKFRHLTDLTEAIRMRLLDIKETWKNARETADTPDTDDETTMESKVVELKHRRKIVADIRKQFDSFTKDAHDGDSIAEFLRAGANTVKWQNFRTACVRIAALIGVSLVGGFLGGMAARGAASIMMGSEAAVETMGLGTMVTSRAIGVATETAVTTAGQTAVFGGSLKDNFLENMLMSLGTSGVMKMIGERAGEAMKVEKAVGGMWAKAAYGGKVVLAETAAITAHTIMGAAMGYVAHRIVTGESQPPPATLEEWMLQGASMAVGRYVGHAIAAHAEARRKLAGAGVDGAPRLVSEADKLVALAKQAEQNPQAKDAMDLLVKRHEVLTDELKVLEELEKSPAKMKAVNMSARELGKTKTELKGQLAESHSQGYAEVALHTSGMHELIPGALWSGTEADVAEMIAKAKGAGIEASAVKDPQGGKWKVKVGEKEVVVEERMVHPESPKASRPVEESSSKPPREHEGAAAAVPHSNFAGNKGTKVLTLEEVHTHLDAACALLNGAHGSGKSLGPPNTNRGQFSRPPFFDVLSPTLIQISTNGKRLSVVIEMMPETEDVARHTFKRGDTSGTISISEKARAVDVTRALAHELAEIQSITEGAPIAATPGSTVIDAHQYGRKAEVNTLLYEIEQAKRDKAPEADKPSELKALVEHMGLKPDTIGTDPEALRLLGPGEAARVDEVLNKNQRRLVVKPTNKVEGKIVGTRWTFEILVDVPGKTTEYAVVSGSIRMAPDPAAHGGWVPHEDTLDFYIQKVVDVKGRQMRVEIEGHRELTEWVIKESTQQYQKQFGELPTLGGSLAYENKLAFQHAYAAVEEAATKNGTKLTPQEIADKAIMATKFGEARGKAGYEVKPTISGRAEIVTGDPPRLASVPDRIEALAVPKGKK